MGSTIKTEFNNIIIVRCMTANFSYANLRQRILPTPQVFITAMQTQEDSFLLLS